MTLDINKYKLENNLDKYKVSQSQPITPLGTSGVGSAISGIAKGGFQILKDLGTTAENVSQAIPKALGVQFPDSLVNKLQSSIEQKKGVPQGSLLAPANPTEAKFKGATQFASYFTPVGEEEIGATMLSKIISGATEMGIKSAAAGDNPKTGAIVGAVTPPAIKGLQKAAPTIGEMALSALHITTGVDREALSAAFKNPTAVAKYMSEKVMPADVRETAVKALDSFKNQVSKKFSTGLEYISKLSPTIGQARTELGKFSNVKSAFSDIINKGTNNVKKILTDQFGIGTNIKNTALDFDKFNSSIVNNNERKNIQSVIDTIKNQTDFSVKGVQRVAARINALSDFEKGAITEKSAVVGQLHNLYKSAIKEVYPELHSLRSEYEASQKIISGLNDIIKPSKTGEVNPTTVTGVIKKLTSLFKEDNGAYIKALQSLEKSSGVDLINQFAATNFKEFAPKTFGSRVADLGLIGGAVSGVLNPLNLLVLPLFSPKLVGKGLTIAGKLSESLGKEGTQAALNYAKKLLQSQTIKMYK